MAEHVSMIEDAVDGVPVLIPEFGYKTFSMVVKSIGGFVNKTSPTYLRTSGVMETRYGGQPKVSHTYPEISAEYIMDLYFRHAQDFKILVISPGLEMACYIGRAMNAPVLPSQFIASAPDRQFVEENLRPNTKYIIGHEMDWPELCCWLKPYDLGALYAPLIDKAKQVIILSTYSGPHNHLGTCRGWAKPFIDILDTHTADENFAGRIQAPWDNGYESKHDKIPHWEFAMEIEQIINLERYCQERGKKTAMISTGDWMGLIPALMFKRLFEKNHIRPRGITFHGYWSCHPFYEAEFARIPIINFEYGADGFVEEFRKIINEIDWEKKDGEYITWPPEFNTTQAVNPAARFESWGFPTRYRSDKPYDVWCWSWDEHPDPRNPTREWIMPKLKERNRFREFNRFVSMQELIDIAKSVGKTEVTVHD